MKTMILQVKEALEKDDFASLDTLLEELFSSGNYSQKQLDEYDKFLQEATLYSELKEDDYKNEALKLINEYLW